MAWLEFNLLSSIVYLENFSPVKHVISRVLSPVKHGMARILSPVKHSRAGILSPPKHGNVHQGPVGRFCVLNLSQYGMHTQRFTAMFVKHATPQMLNK